MPRFTSPGNWLSAAPLQPCRPSRDHTSVSSIEPVGGGGTVAGSTRRSVTFVDDGRPVGAVRTVTLPPASINWRLPFSPAPKHFDCGLAGAGGGGGGGGGGLN